MLLLKRLGAWRHCRPCVNNTFRTNNFIHRDQLSLLDILVRLFTRNSIVLHGKNSNYKDGNEKRLWGQPIPQLVCGSTIAIMRLQSVLNNDFNFVAHTYQLRSIWHLNEICARRLSWPSTSRWILLLGLFGVPLNDCFLGHLLFFLPLGGIGYRIATEVDELAPPVVVGPKR